MILDASVAVKLLVKEPDSLSAAGVAASAAPCFAPDFLHDEIFSALAKAVRKKSLGAKEMATAQKSWMNLLEQKTIRLLPHAPDRMTAIELSMKLRHAYYDCLYLAMAQREKLPLLTADEKFHAKAKQTYAHVFLLSDKAAE